jgi:uncharacterized phage protein gp47/JayE
MADIDFPTLTEIVERSRKDFRGEMPSIDPSIEQHFAKAIVESNANRSFDIVLLQKQVVNQAFPQTSTGPYLENWAEYDGLQKFAAQPSLGSIVIQGLLGSNIISGTLYTSPAGDEYETQSSLTLSTISQSLSSAVADVGKVVTCETSTAHSLATGVTADISNLTDGASTSGAVITVVDEFTFTFTAPNVTTIGDVLDVSAQYSFIGGVVEVQSVEEGSDKNLTSGTILTLVTPIAGVNESAFVALDGIRGGVDEETEDNLKDRLLEKRANPVANFNEGAVIQFAKSVPSVDKVFVLPITPFPGAATIYFFVKDTVNRIPSASQITQVRNAILANLPITNDPDNIFVSAPNTVSVSHVIDSLAPSTQTMKDAIGANLSAFYVDQVNIGQDITLDQIKLTVQSTQDPVTGEFPTFFTLTTPSSLTIIASDEIAIYGGVSFT